MARRRTPAKAVAALKHKEAKCKNIPPPNTSRDAEEGSDTGQVVYVRGAMWLDEEKHERNRDLDPQLVWRGKDQRDRSDQIVNASPLCIQEKVLVDDLVMKPAHTVAVEPNGWRRAPHSAFGY